MRLSVEEVGSGLHPSETVVVIKAVHGQERLTISKRSISQGSIEIGWPLGEDGNRVLVELPRETQAGAWRVWVNRAQLLESERIPA